MGKNPLVTERSFHSQFALDTKLYRDNNNYLQVHNVKTYDDRIFVASFKEYRFFEVDSYPAWVSTVMKVEYNVSFDDGKSFQKDKDRSVMLGAYFFVGEILWEDSRTVYDWF